MKFEKLYDILVNLGFDCNKEENDVYRINLNDMEYLVFGNNFLIYKPFLVLKNYYNSGKEWFDCDLELSDHVEYKYFSSKNPLMLNKEDFDGYNIFRVEGDFASVSAYWNPSEIVFDDIAKFSEFIIKKIVSYQSKTKNAKFKFKINHKNKEEEEFVDSPENIRKQKRLYNEYINDIIDNPENLYNEALENLNNSILG